MATTLETREAADLWMASIYNSYESRVRTYLASIKTPRAQIDDVVQDTLESLLNLARAGVIDQGVEPWGLIRTVARRRAADNGRRELRMMPLLDGADPPDVAEASVEFEYGIASNSLVIQCLRGLPPLEALTLVLRDVEGCSVTEISELIGRSAHATAALLKRGRKRFLIRYQWLEEQNPAAAPLLSVALRRFHVGVRRAAIRLRSRLGGSQPLFDATRMAIEVGAMAALGVASLVGSSLESPRATIGPRAAGPGAHAGAVAFTASESGTRSDGQSSGAKRGRTGRLEPNRPVATDTRVRVVVPSAAVADVSWNPDDDDHQLVVEAQLTPPALWPMTLRRETAVSCKDATVGPTTASPSAAVAAPGLRTAAECGQE